jgi:hypothetical protein
MAVGMEVEYSGTVGAFRIRLSTEVDSWTLCLNLTGKSRPLAFAANPGSGKTLEVLTRAQPSSKNAKCGQ